MGDLAGPELELQNGDIGQGVLADEDSGYPLPVAQRNDEALRLTRHVIVRDDMPCSVPDEARSRALGDGHHVSMAGGVLYLKGEVEPAIALAERAIAEDPLEVWPRMNLHAYLQAAGRDHEAYGQALKVLELDPNLVVARVSIAHFHAAWGQLADAVAAARNAHAVGPWYPDARATLAALLRLSRAEGADAESRSLVASLGSGMGGDCRARAIYHLLCGDVDAGADWAATAIADRDFSMLWYLRFVVCRPLRASHRWPSIARTLNLPA